ncbi:MAG: GntP family permease [Clostridiales bacterium]|nr:GntP family permease [Clostridiales bacterium]
MLMVIFVISIAVLLFCIMKLKLTAFVAILVTVIGTGIACGIPFVTVTAADGTTTSGIATIIQDSFGSTLGSIGMVTGLGVMLGMFMYESGGINNICNAILKTLGR